MQRNVVSFIGAHLVIPDTSRTPDTAILSEIAVQIIEPL